MTFCPSCGGADFELKYSLTWVRREMRLRDSFIARRLDHKPAPAERKDLTDFMHGEPARLAACRRCGTFVRDEPALSGYEGDTYDQELTAHLYPQYLTAFQRKRVHYNHLLRPHADVVELGSHLGAFLQTAEEWNWRPVGLDIGRETSAFARSRGLTVYREEIEDTTIASGSADAVFVWNCFEQIPRPGPALRAMRRTLKPDGLLILRVPNALFYQMASRTHSDTFRALAYNNLLGFPYLYGYTERSLNRLAEANGFEPLMSVNSQLLTMPFAEMPERVAREESQIRRTLAATVPAWSRGVGELAGPWIELVFRRTMAD